MATLPSSSSHNHTSRTLEAKLEFLRQPDSYPEKPRQVESVQTHMSWVFLTDRYAYKLKKPVRYDFLDFSTVDARHYDCNEEVRLNGRLAPDVYLGTVPLTVNPSGEMELDGQGTAVEWLVQMRRLPAERFLDQAIRKHVVRETDIIQVASALANFYKRSPPIEIAPDEYTQRFEADIYANLRELTLATYGLSADLVAAVCAAQIAFLKREFHLFDVRVREGRIIEAHGDLRPEHICLEESKPVIIDCLEFRREFRILDPADELAFLALECERIGAQAFVPRLLFDQYRRITGDSPKESLLQFYMSYRASLRAKLAIWHLREPQVHDALKWHQLAKQYLDLAARHIQCIAKT